MMAIAPDANTTQIVMAIIGLLGTVFTGIMAWFMAKTGRIAKAAAEKVEEVKQDLEQSVEDRNKRLNAIKDRVEDVHERVNGQLGKTLKIGMISAQALAYSTGEEKHKQLAKIATDEYEAHLATEKKVALEKQSKSQP